MRDPKMIWAALKRKHCNFGSLHRNLRSSEAYPRLVVREGSARRPHFLSVVEAG